MGTKSKTYGGVGLITLIVGLVLALPASAMNLSQAPATAWGTPTNPPPIVGTDLGVSAVELPDPLGELIQELTVDVGVGFDHLGSELALAGINRWTWADHLNIEAFVPTPSNPWGWEFDVLMFLEFREVGEGLGCTFALPVNNPTGYVPQTPGEVPTYPVSQCWLMTAEAMALGLPGTSLLFDNDGFMDLLWPLGASLFGGGPTTNGNGDRIYECSDLRWDSNNGRYAAMAGAGTTAISTGVAAFSAGWASQIATWGALSLSGMVLGEMTLGTAYAIGVLATFTGGVAVAAIVVGAAVVGGVAARALFASQSFTGCPGCQAKALAGEECRVQNDDCVCKPTSAWGPPPQCGGDTRPDGKDDNPDGTARDPNDSLAEVPEDDRPEHEHGEGFGSGSLGAPGASDCTPGTDEECADACDWAEDAGPMTLMGAQTDRSCNICEDGSVECFEFTTVPPVAQ